MRTEAYEPIAGAIRVPFGLLRPCPTNPRKTFREGYIAELADSISEHDVTTPLLARPTGGPAGAAQFEIVFGECRWRACGLLEQRAPSDRTVPIIARELTDFQVAELQIVENIQRNDLHPLEEAEHFERMLADPSRPAGYGVAELAAHIGKEPAYVTRRLKLLALCESARAAFRADKLTAHTALLVARVPSDHAQNEIVRHITTWGGEPMGAKAAAKFIQERYMLRLATAPFDPSDATLCADAGPCGACPKRTGANPQLFDDIGDADTCTDPACFALKKQALRDRNVQAERDAGHQVLTGDEARKVCTAEGRALKPGLYALEQKVPFELGDATLTVREVVDKADLPNAAVTVVDHPEREGVMRAVATEVLADALKRLKLSRKQLELKAKKAQREQPAPTGSRTALNPTPMQTEAENLARGESGNKLLDELLKFDVLPKMAKTFNDTALTQFTRGAEHKAEAILTAHAIAAHLVDDESYGLPEHGISRLLLVLLLAGAGSILELHEAAQLLQMPEPPKGYDKQIAWAWALEEEAATRLVLVLLAVQEPMGIAAPADDPFVKFPAQVAEALDVDADFKATAKHLVKERLQLELLARGKSTAKQPKAATKKASSATKPAKSETKATKGKTPARYRNAATGETWSGRGLQPKWLKVAIANGKKLSDFDIAATPPAPAPAAKPVLSSEAAWPFPKAR